MSTVPGEDAARGTEPIAHDPDEQEQSSVVWIVESGDYEQRGIVGAFATEQLARAYCDEHEPGETPSAYRLWDRRPLRVITYTVQRVMGAGQGTVTSGWEALPGLGDAREKRYQYASNEVYCDHAASGRFDWWNKRRSSAVHIEVVGTNKVAVDALCDSLTADVLAGATPPDGDDA